MTQTMWNRPVSPMPHDAVHALAHLNAAHGWRQSVADPGMIQAHRYAHGIDGRPDLIDAQLNHEHGAPSSTALKSWAWVAAAVPVLFLVGFLAASGNAESIIGLMFGVAAIGAYFIPTFIATSRKHHNVGA